MEPVVFKVLERVLGVRWHYATKDFGHTYAISGCAADGRSLGMMVPIEYKQANPLHVYEAQCAILKKLSTKETT